MGARVARMFRNFNLENRVHREISKEKPRAAPRYAAHSDPGSDGGLREANTGVLHQKNDPLLKHLKSVYVDSTDPAEVRPGPGSEISKSASEGEEAERRPLRFSLPGPSLGLVELTDVPKGKLTIAEALKALNSHRQHPQTWTPQKIAQEYALDLKDTKALLEFFIPFQVHILPPTSGKTKQIKAS
ncbi:NADH dehydrogenase [ubiquinone] 1 alpha subcomplex assembly factor 4 [Sphaeramia orbicularis]|uniref:NADH dehydrogenase [ubiquinone] 1 alpha subcomplex assembly factor 4 n=1 Tax=Sphaeramia orbicularis TaxID=375764 RepID=A0A673B602_9TELE|nr:NADH dehydrogenase [ubiquinone] 1 alpha subcomplex assembly factor 4 [Sphaeramia orbicularis]